MMLEQQTLISDFTGNLNYTDNGIVNLADNSNITGDVTTNIDGTGILNILGTSTVNGNVGSNTEKIGTVNSGAAGESVTFNDNVFATVLNNDAGTTNLDKWFYRKSKLYW